jgi:hypothetical protein
MPRPATGQVVVDDRRRSPTYGPTYGLRFRAYGRREYVALGTAAEGWTKAKAQTELQNVLADVRRGIWRPADKWSKVFPPPATKWALKPPPWPSFEGVAPDASPFPIGGSHVGPLQAERLALAESPRKR